ncbi:hypothetical protein [Sphingopyxis sp.]|uniref:hypothetical protein n=1 Tax=Sphingopyxis sp. TaxID=1908224 RepID=UPI003BA95DF5
MDYFGENRLLIAYFLIALMVVALCLTIRHVMIERRRRRDIHRGYRRRHDADGE